MAIPVISTANTFSQLVYSINQIIGNVNILTSQPAPFNWRGAWSNTTTYFASDVATANNHVWIAVDISLNSAPTGANANWGLMIW
jgi:hypothetical protein